MLRLLVPKETIRGDKGKRLERGDKRKNKVCPDSRITRSDASINKASKRKLKTSRKKNERKSFNRKFRVAGCDVRSKAIQILTEGIQEEMDIGGTSRKTK